MKKIFLGLSLFSFGLFQLQAQTTLPYSNSFTSLTGTTHKSTTTTVPYGSDYGITLTDASSQSTLIYLDSLDIATEDGFKISFNFNIYEGGGSNVAGDGFALVLFNSETTTVTAGMNGSGLGYAYGRGTTSQTNGLTGAYMGIGFDVYGSFKNFTTSLTDYRSGLYLEATADKSIREARGAITIRGPVQQTSIIANVPVEQQGYPVLFTQNVRNPTNANSKYQLNTAGDYDTSSNTTFPGFTLYTDKRSESANDASYRRAVFLMIPGSKSGVDGYYMNLYVNHADTLTRVITDYFINATENVKYKEIIKAGGTTAAAARLTTAEISLAPPKTLNLGFTASTGGAYEKVTVSNLNVTLPFAAVAQDFSVDDLCATKGNTTTFDALSSSAGYESKTYDPNANALPDVKNINKSSFQFMVINSLGLFEASPTPHSMTTDYGTYTYDETTGYITFKSSKTLTDEGVSENLHFSVNSLAPLNGDNYRSIAATITAKFKTGCAEQQRRYIMINR